MDRGPARARKGRVIFPCDFSLPTRRFVRIVRVPFPKPHFFMSQHRSLKGQSTIAAKRNVLKRFERVEILTQRGQYKPGDKVMGLRKTKPNA